MQPKLSYEKLGISTDQLFLYNTGNNYYSYYFLGAHIIELNNRSVVRFAVWAPNAKSVSVVGDFNDWDNSKDVLELIGTTGVWVGICDDAKPGSIYKYSIISKSNEQILKADPYATKSELRPGTASIVDIPSNFKWSDARWLNKRAKTNLHDSPMNIYELHCGSWKQHDDGTFYTYRELADELVSYTTQMGYTHIELMPIMEYPFDGSWGYQVTGYFSITARYGTLDEFKYLVNLCHKNKIGVILDWVPAHFPRDAHGLRQFDGVAEYEYADSRLGEHKDWGTLVFDYSKSEVASFLISSAHYWVKECHIDGLRVDAVSSMLYRNYSRNDGEWLANKYGGAQNLEAIEFFQKLNKSLKSSFQGFICIAEESTAWPNVTKGPQDESLGFDFKWNMGWMNDTLRYVELDPLFRKGNHNLLNFVMMYAYSEHFILPFSHDEVVHGKKSMIDKMFGSYDEKFDTYRALLAYYMALPGKKLMFMGGEIAQFIEWRYYEGIEWKLLAYDKHRELQDFVKSLNGFYINNPAFWLRDDFGDGFKWINADDSDSSVVSFIRYSDKSKDTVIVVVNFTPVERNNYIIGVDEPGKYEIVFESSYNENSSGTLNAETKSFYSFPYTLSVNLKGNSAMYIKKKSNRNTNRKEKLK